MRDVVIVSASDAGWQSLQGTLRATRPDDLAACHQRRAGARAATRSQRD